MTRSSTIVALAGFVACGPAVDTTPIDDGGGSSSSSSAAGEAEGSSAGDETSTGELPAECRTIAGPLASRWSTVVDPDTLTYGDALHPTAEGGAWVVSSNSMVRLDGQGAPQSVQWFGSLNPAAFAFGEDDHVWVAGDDGGVVVAHYDDGGELSRATRPLLQEDDYVAGLLREAGGVLLMTYGDGLQLEYVDDAQGFGAAITLPRPEFLDNPELHEGGRVTLSEREIDVLSLLMIDRAGTQLWRSELPVDDDDFMTPFVSTRVVIGEVVYVASSARDLGMPSGPATYQLFGLDLDSGARRFALDVDPSVIAVTPCGALYRVELRAQDVGPAILVLLEHDAAGTVVGEAELAGPTALPPGFTLADLRTVAASPTGDVLVHGGLEDAEGTTIEWVAAY